MIKKFLVCAALVTLFACSKSGGDSSASSPSPSASGSSLPWINTWQFDDGASNHTLVITSSQVPKQDYDIVLSRMIPGGYFIDKFSCKETSNTVLTCGMFANNYIITKNVDNFSLTVVPDGDKDHPSTYYAPDHLVVDSLVGHWKSADAKPCLIDILKMNDVQYDVSEMPYFGSSRWGIFDVVINGDNSRTLNLRSGTFLNNQTFTFHPDTIILNSINDFAKCAAFSKS